MRPEDIAFRPDVPGGAVRLAGRDGAGAVKVRWLGTAGFALEHGGTVVLFDPYVTRASLARCVAAPLVPDAAAVRRYAPRADAIVVGHTHFDHALDVPAIARATGARVLGSRSAARLCVASGVPAERVDVVEQGAGDPPAVREVGPFTLTFVPSVHSPLLLGRVPFPGEIADCEDVPVVRRAHEYRCGAVFGVEIRVAGKTLYHAGSAEILDGPARSPGGVDLLLLCVAGWRTSRRFPERIGRHLDPGAVLLSHWDDFTKPLDRPARIMPSMQLPRLVERLERAVPGVRVGLVPALGEVWV